MIDPKLRAMYLINRIIRKYGIAVPDYYRYLVDNPISVMLNCRDCPHYGNNGCGISSMEQLDCQSGVCDIKREGLYG